MCVPSLGGGGGGGEGVVNKIEKPTKNAKQRTNKYHVPRTKIMHSYISRLIQHKDSHYITNLCSHQPARNPDYRYLRIQGFILFCQPRS